MTAVGTRRPDADRRSSESERHPLWRRRNVAALLVVVFLACVLVAWLLRDEGTTPVQPAVTTTTAPLDTSGDEHFLPRELESYDYHAPQTSDATADEAVAITGAKNVVIRVLVPKSRDTRLRNVTMIVARYAPGDPDHQKNLESLLAPRGDVEPRVPPVTKKVNGAEVQVIADQTGNNRADAVLWRRDANIDVFLQGAPSEQLLDIMSELIR